ncbi:hypothetical protein J2X97_003283 [Epilithonimonas hungarica]|nr:hypothetical protein [Epilithonimonas hungarica]
MNTTNGKHIMTFQKLFLQLKNFIKRYIEIMVPITFIGKQKKIYVFLAVLLYV